MAVLKDLIVHGNSRFLNGAKFNTINAESIGAEEGIFNKLIATTLDAKTATINDLTAQNATVVGLLDVQGELHTNAWTNANIANIGGSFYISPTVEPTDGTTTISITRNSATSWTVSASGTFATDFIKSGTATSGVAWPANSLVLITGDVVVGDMVYPLGTLKGTLSAQVTATAASTSKTITITGVTDAQNNNSPSVLQELYEVNNNANISNATFKKGKISLYKLGSNPIGILLSSMGTSSNSIIDIYGGVSTNPNVRIGHLAGLPNVNGSAPTGWGIYTDNGYFSGVVVSTSGKIANFTINGSKLYSNNHSAYNTAATGIYIGDDYISFGSGGVTYFNSSGTGKVGPWTLTTTALYNTKTSYNNSNAGVYIGTDYIAGGAGEKWWLKSDGSAKIGAMTLTSAGVLTVPAANVSGELTAATINGSKITAGTVSTNQLAANAVTAAKIAASSIAARHLMITDNTNLVSTTELYADSLPVNITENWKGVIDNGYIVKKTATNLDFVLTEYTPNNFKQNDELYYEFYAKGAAEGDILFRAYCYNASKTFLTANGNTIHLTTSEQKFSGSFKLADANWNTAAWYVFGIYDNRSTKSQVYIRQLIVRRKNGGELIVDGSITANHLSANSITVGKMDSSTKTQVLNSNLKVGGRNLLMYTSNMVKASSNAVTDKTGIHGWASFYPTITNDGVKITYNGTKDGPCVGFPLYNNGSVSSNVDVMLSFEARGNLTSSTQFYWLQSTGANIGFTFTPTGPALSETVFQKYTFNAKHASANIRTCTGIIFYYASSAISSDQWVEIKANSVKLELGNTVTDWTPAPEDLDVHKYVTDIDSNKGITVKPKDSSGNDFLQMNSTAIEFFRNSTTNSVMRLTDNSFRLGLEASNHTTIDTNGLHIWSGTESTSTNEIALFSTTARIGKSNNSRFLMNATSLQAYNSSNQLYFEVSSTGMTYGTNTVATTAYADQAEANASYSLIVKTTAIDYAANTATLVATPYYQGSTTLPTGVTLAYQWYKDSVSNSSPNNRVGTNSNTLSVTNAMGLDHTYICIISSSN